ncbi:hypothetical protein SALBM311S_12291 [Streptomyces alboniger]
MYLLVLSEQGLIGLLALAGSWLALLVCALKALVRARRQEAHGLDCAVVGAAIERLTVGRGRVGEPGGTAARGGSRSVPGRCCPN